MGALFVTNTFALGIACINAILELTNVLINKVPVVTNPGKWRLDV